MLRFFATWQQRKLRKQYRRNLALKICRKAWSFIILDVLVGTGKHGVDLVLACLSHYDSIYM